MVSKVQFDSQKQSLPAVSLLEKKPNSTGGSFARPAASSSSDGRRNRMMRQRKDERVRAAAHLEALAVLLEERPLLGEAFLQLLKNALCKCRRILFLSPQASKSQKVYLRALRAGAPLRSTATVARLTSCIACEAPIEPHWCAPPPPPPPATSWPPPPPNMPPKPPKPLILSGASSRGVLASREHAWLSGEGAEAQPFGRRQLPNSPPPTAH